MVDHIDFLVCNDVCNILPVYNKISDIHLSVYQNVGVFFIIENYFDKKNQANLLKKLFWISPSRLLFISHILV